MITTQMLYDALMPVIKMLFIPLVMWVVLPGILSQTILRKRHSYSIGAFLGFISVITFGPWANH